VFSGLDCNTQVILLPEFRKQIKLKVCLGFVIVCVAYTICIYWVNLPTIGTFSKIESSCYGFLVDPYTCTANTCYYQTTRIKTLFKFSVVCSVFTTKFIFSPNTTQVLACIFWPLAILLATPRFDIKIIYIIN